MRWPCPCTSQSRSLLVRRQNVNTAVQAVKVPRLAVADIFIQDQRLILGQDANVQYQS